MLTSQELNNLENVLSDQMVWKVEIYQHTVDIIIVFIKKGNYLTNFVHGKPKMH